MPPQQPQAGAVKRKPASFARTVNFWFGAAEASNRSLAMREIGTSKRCLTFVSPWLRCVALSSVEGGADG